MLGKAPKIKSQDLILPTNENSCGIIPQIGIRMGWAKGLKVGENRTIGIVRIAAVIYRRPVRARFTGGTADSERPGHKHGLGCVADQCAHGVAGEILCRRYGEILRE